MKRTTKYGVVFVSLVCLSGCYSETSKTDLAAENVANQNPTKKIQLLEEANASNDQKAALINVELGLGYLQQGQVARAKSKLVHALKLAPKLPETHSAMAYFLEMVGENNDAELSHKKAVQLAKAKGAFYNNYGAFLCRQQRFIDADKTFHLALKDKEYTRTAEVYENAGLCALKGGNQAKAENYFDTALKRDPNRATAILELAALDIVKGKAFAARKLLSQHKMIAEPNARSLWLGIQASKVLKDQEAVKNQVDLLKSLFQDSPEYQAYLQSEKGPS